ncbi:MAG: helix-turn-helix domain-containing protein [Ardenticatenaceae bacterium]
MYIIIMSNKLANSLLVCVIVYIVSRVAPAAAYVAPRTPVQLALPTVMKAHRIRINPTPSQEDYFNRASGTARFAYNWGLARWNEMFAAGEKASAPRLRGEK